MILKINFLVLLPSDPYKFIYFKYFEEINAEFICWSFSPFVVIVITN